MTVKGRLQDRRQDGWRLYRTVSAATSAGSGLGRAPLFAQRNGNEGVEELRQGVESVGRIVGMRYSSLKTIYSATYLTTAGAGYERANACSTQCPAENTEASLGVTDQATGTVSTAALPVLAGVLPAHMEVMVGW
ncbi:hypothetical protein EVAR_89964_1 [Eumeta japonica]|uniref:Uncharacterized protein n=1 Tax=Eumeta variegata TaxID=151549 RepID=A0A4C2ADS5_EUMVA|nr:hypothetical protein EVAR_89964_1 [Eumeta japonica]